MANIRHRRAPFFQKRTIDLNVLKLNTTISYNCATVHTTEN